MVAVEVAVGVMVGVGVVKRGRVVSRYYQREQRKTKLLERCGPQTKPVFAIG